MKTKSFRVSTYKADKTNLQENVLGKVFIVWTFLLKLFTFKETLQLLKEVYKWIQVIKNSAEILPKVKSN